MLILSRVFSCGELRVVRIAIEGGLDRAQGGAKLGVADGVCGGLGGREEGVDQAAVALGEKERGLDALGGELPAVCAGDAADEALTRSRQRS